MADGLNQALLRHSERTVAQSEGTPRSRSTFGSSRRPTAISSSHQTDAHGATSTTESTSSSRAPRAASAQGATSSACRCANSSIRAAGEQGDHGAHARGRRKARRVCVAWQRPRAAGHGESSSTTQFEQIRVDDLPDRLPELPLLARRSGGERSAELVRSKSSSGVTSAAVSDAVAGNKAKTLDARGRGRRSTESWAVRREDRPGQRASKVSPDATSETHSLRKPPAPPFECPSRPRRLTCTFVLAAAFSPMLTFGACGETRRRRRRPPSGHPGWYSLSIRPIFGDTR